MLQLYSPDRDGRILGSVSAVGLIDELSTNNFLLIETFLRILALEVEN
jgi:hypothetical protein